MSYFGPEVQRTMGVVFFPAYDWCISPTHPEREERLLYTHDQFREEGLFDIRGIAEYKPGIATLEDISRVHFCPPGFENVVSTPHYISAGSAMMAADIVLKGERERAFALTRPPGHHAMRIAQSTRGFCTINIEGVMLEHLRHKYGVKKIAIVDTDCHHGDGTQDIYWYDPDVLVINLHQDGRTLYPGSGFKDELGAPCALGKTINIPLPTKTGDEGYLYAVHNLVKPLLDSWKPDLIINSAGQDNHFSDPLTDMRITAQGYGALVEAIDPHIAVLEGGYSTQGALPYVNLAVVLAMAGLPYDNIIEPDLNSVDVSTSPEVMAYIRELCDSLNDTLAYPERMTHGYTFENGWWVRARSVFYDSGGMRDHQQEYLQACDNCNGVLLIESKTDRGKKSLAIFTPKNVCPKCRTVAEGSFYKMQKNGICVEYYNSDDDAYLRFLTTMS